ncbi:App1 family protein [Alloalcanivorax sp. C16-2]|uniref:App1 family protein n=1 Tax=Alloalcanivorax TaxID=3020832 RepID=UPI001931A53A|nr:phosphatase domain-containing protein [Alloalcanivorax marinus]MBL7251569.1 DUF2183 domain-containing protein [Alloalcanivorax marinus]
MNLPTPRKLYRGLRKMLRFLARPARRGGRRGGRVIQTYRGYGSRRSVFLIGRVFRQPGIGLNLKEGPLDDIVNIVRRTVRWGVRDARLTVTVGAASVDVITDRDGYFHVTLDVDEDWPDQAFWQQARLRLHPGRREGEREPVEASADIYIPPRGLDHAVISDIDDTVIYTGVASKLTMMYQLFVLKARHRTAFPGVSAFYRALFHGDTGERRRPMLYVSRGPWSIYDVLEEFFHLNRIPHGPILFLREWGVTLQRPLPIRAKDHKAMLIRRMLALYDQVPFVLIGDSGQRDPEVYAELVEQYPDRIRAIYIRHVHRGSARDEAIQALAERAAAGGCEMILAKDSLEMAQHAFQKGLIARDGLEEVRQDCRRRPAE